MQSDSPFPVETIMSLPSQRPFAASRAASPDPLDADRLLHARVRDRLRQTTLRWLDIQIHVHHGLVRLCGSLRDARLRAHAEWLVFTTEGVLAVCSDWQVTHDQSPDPQCH